MATDPFNVKASVTDALDDVGIYFCLVRASGHTDASSNEAPKRF
jgi:hypothetical protein